MMLVNSAEISYDTYEKGSSIYSERGELYLHDCMDYGGLFDMCVWSV